MHSQNSTFRTRETPLREKMVPQLCEICPYSQRPSVLHATFEGFGENVMKKNNLEHVDEKFINAVSLIIRLEDVLPSNA